MAARARAEATRTVLELPGHCAGRTRGFLYLRMKYGTATKIAPMMISTTLFGMKYG